MSTWTLSNEELHRARERAEARTREAPGEAEAWSSLAGVYTLLGQRVDAVRAWSEASRLSSAAEVHVHYAQAAALIERWPDVVQALERLDPQAVSDASAAWSCSALATLAARATDSPVARARAVALRRRHVALRPHDVAARADLGVMLLDLGDARAACAAFAQVAAMDPSYFDDNVAERVAYARAREVLS
jgi:cytochrome c-type biogenesis protein CcmH/NrfG